MGLFLFFQPTEIHAQFTCEGSGCAYLPFSQSDLNRILNEFETQYTDVLFDDMAEAAAVSNIMGPPMGTVNLNGFTFGAQVRAGYYPVHEIDVNIPDVATFENVSAAGAAINPGLFFGVNLGRLFIKDYDPYSGDTPSFISPLRFDLYLSSMSLSYDEKDSGGVSGTLKGKVRSSGVDLRYHLVEGRNMGVGPLLRFRGVSLGVGYHKMKQSVSLIQDPDNMSINLVSGTDMVWNGINSVVWRSDLESYPVDLRTGVQLFYFLNLTLGGGVSFNKGEENFYMSRYGQANVVTDLLLGNLYGLPNMDSFLSMAIRGKGEVPARLPYATVGVEIQVPFFRLSVEGLVAKKSYGANVGFRFEI